MAETIPTHLRRIASDFRTQRFAVRAKGDHAIAEDLSAAIPHLDAAAAALKRWSKKYEPEPSNV